jgi:hypothetical protein
MEFIFLRWYNISELVVNVRVLLTWAFLNQGSLVVRLKSPMQNIWLNVSEYWWPRTQIPFGVVTIPSSLTFSWLSPDLTKVTRQIPQMEHELLTLPEKLSSPRIAIGFMLCIISLYMSSRFSLFLVVIADTICVQKRYLVRFNNHLFCRGWCFLCIYLYIYIGD